MKTRMMLFLICVLGSVCMFALANAPPVSSKDYKPVAIKVCVSTQPVASAQSVIFETRAEDAKIDSAVISARGHTPKPKVNSPQTRKITLHNKDQPVLRE